MRRGEVWWVEFDPSMEDLDSWLDLHVKRV